MQSNNLRDALIEILGTYGWAETLDEMSILFEAQGVQSAQCLTQIAWDVAKETGDTNSLRQSEIAPSPQLARPPSPVNQSPIIRSL